jgi:hypothetical protein
MTAGFSTVATHILAFEGNSQVVSFEGNYADYEADRRRRSAPGRSAAPHPLQPLVRS